MVAIALSSPKSDQTYFDWLVSLTGPLGTSYQILLEIAHNINFNKRIPNDFNRAEDGLDLRDEYESTTGNPSIHGDCTMLEMMIGLSRRMNDVVYGYDDERRVWDWFWVLIRNLNLYDYIDDLMDPLSEEECKNAITDVSKRKYYPNGVGGLFPIEDYDGDMRKTELWYQMQYWLEDQGY